jgi:hypothetical protein
VFKRFVAPEKWIRISDPTDTAAFEASDPDSTIFLKIRVYASEKDGPQLLREASPVGAMAAPIREFDLDRSLQAHTIECDLTAGNFVTQKNATCTTNVPTTCVMLTLTHAPGQTTRETPQPVLDLMDTMEVTP